MYATKHNDKVDRISDEAMDLLVNHDFPGNVRELRNLIQRAVILCEGNELLPEHFKISRKNNNENNYELSAQTAQPMNNLEREDETADFDLESNEKKLILKALEKAGGNKAKAAALLRITWQALDRRMKKFGME